MDGKLKHLEMIQAVITRMGSNSFSVKGWSVTLVAALFALAASQNKPDFVLIAFLPAIVFWGLDAYYLRQERLFRALYNDVASKKEEEIDFSMNTSAAKGAADVASLPMVAASTTLLMFHGAIVLAIILAKLFL
jgi:hypothetical protein